MRKSVARFSAMILILLAISGAATAQAYTLTVLHTNDIHSHLDVDDKGRYGSARVKGVADSIRATRPHTVMLDAGDMLAGTIFYSHYKGEADGTTLNMLGYDAATLGNHEFDKGPEGLATFLTYLEIPVVSSNLDFSGEPAIQSQVREYLIKEVGGKRIGFVGATLTGTSEISRPCETIVFRDEIESLNEAVAALQAESVEIIVAITHVGLSYDQQIAAAVDGIDIIVGGHSHSRAEPTVINSPSGNPVLVVQAGSNNNYLGHLDVTFDESGVVTDWSGSPIWLGGTDLPMDDEVAAYIAQLNEELLPIAQKVVGRTSITLTRSWDQENALGNLITDAMLEYMHPQGAQIALTNNGGIRTDIPAGDITLGKIMELIPFGNTIAIFDIKGRDLWQVFDHGVSRVGSGDGCFLHNSGAVITWDPKLPRFDYEAQTGGRVVSVKIDVKGDGNYVELDPNATYRVVSNNFIRGGGDGYAVLAEKAIDPYDAGPLDVDVLLAYLEQHDSISPTIEGRIVVGSAVTAITDEQNLPGHFRLSAAYPNPFNPNTMLRLELDRSQHTTAAVYDMLGRRVALLYDAMMSAGTHTLTWNATDDDGRRVASSMYLIRLQAGDRVETRKLLFIR